MSFASSVFFTLLDALTGEGIFAWKYRILSWVIFIFLVTWCFGANSRPLRVEKTEILAPVEITLPDGNIVQVISYNDCHNYDEVNIINLNKEYGAKINNNKIKVTQYELGYYCGVKFEHIKDKIELVNVENDSTN